MKEIVTGIQLLLLLTKSAALSYIFIPQQIGYKGNRYLIVSHLFV